MANLAGDAGAASWAGSGYNKVLLDPPRSGAAEVMGLLGNIGPQRIVYVSCHPGSLARDAATLVHEKGYHLLSAGVMDMFPHTTHVESIALFEAG
jgi:23S rRNA (uracil1939-C5)-methyltransferase